MFHSVDKEACAEAGHVYTISSQSQKHSKNLQPLLKECQGIGIEATHTEIIEALQECGYLSLEKKYLVKAYLPCEVVADDIRYQDTPTLVRKLEHYL